MLIGLVKWFDKEKGFGTIATLNDGEFFLHINNFEEKPNNLTGGTAIIFKQSFDNRKNRATASNCRIVSNREDFSIILKTLWQTDTIVYEHEISGTNRLSNTFKKKQLYKVSLKMAAISQLFSKIDSETIKSIVVDYFENELLKEDFIKYCEFIEERIEIIVAAGEKELLLTSIFEQFRVKLNDYILFKIWKARKFKYIAYKEDEYEIPVDVLTKFSDEIGIIELKRIIGFAFGEEFCESLVTKRIQAADKLTLTDVKNLYLLLHFVKTEIKEILQLQLTVSIKKAYLNEIIEQINSLGDIQTNDDFNRHNSLKKIIGFGLDADSKKELETEIDNKIIQKCTENFRVGLWLKGLIQDIKFDIIAIEFLSCNSDNKILILKKLPINEQFELLKIYTEKNNYELTYSIIESYLKAQNSFLYYFELKEKIFNAEFLKDKIGNDLLYLFNNYFNNTANIEDKYRLFFKGLSEDISLPLVIKNASSLSSGECEKLFKKYSTNQSFIFELLKLKLATADQESLIWIISLAKEYLNNDEFEKFDIEILEAINIVDYFKLWEKAKVSIFPKKHIVLLLNEKYDDYIKINNWMSNGIVSGEIISELLLDYLSTNQPVTDRLIFYRQYNHIKFLIDLDQSLIKHIEQLHNDFYSVILWFLGCEIEFNYELLASKFIYFSPDDQVKIIRKLFFLKANGTISLALSDLFKLTRVDLDFYKINQKFNPEIPLDISTEIILSALMNYSETNKFLVEGQLLSLVLNNLYADKTRKFKLSNYFEACLGRLSASYDWSTRGEISKVKFGDDKYYFAVKFEYDLEMVDEVRQIEGRKWNNETKVWGIPWKHEAEVLEFARKNRFFLDFEGSKYANNTHLATFSRKEVPNGISFCEGRLANKQDEQFKKDFWWCGNQKCLQKCETIHTTDNWELYTLLDFCEILGLNTDETNRLGDFIPKGHYYQFIGLINRFNRLLEKLYCEECNEILHPVDTAHFAAHTVVRFCCENGKCGQYKKEVYLNHCLNGQCNSIIDSRVSQRCSNGLFICDNCGSCCSHSMLQRRLSNLEITGGYIHPNLITCINEKLGHLERAEYFCYKCNGEMVETSNDIFFCSKCHVTFDTTKYKIKRPHVHLKKTKSAIDIADKIDDDIY